LALALAAYTAYGDHTGGVNYQDLPMPAWADLGPTIQGAWIAAADAIPATQAGYLWRATVRTILGRAAPGARDARDHRDARRGEHAVGGVRGSL
jgi:hypothetical protein